MKGKQGALDGKSHADQRDRDKKRHPVRTVLHDHMNRFPDIAHQQMPRQVIQHTDSQKEKAGAQKAHDHVAHRRLNGSSVLSYHNQAAGRNGIDLHKHIGREKVVGIDKGKKRAQEQVYQNVIHIVLALHHLVMQLFAPAQHGQQHNHAEKQRHPGFQYARPDLVAPWCGKMPHHIDIAFLFADQIDKQYKRQYTHHGNNNGVYPLRRLSWKHGTDGS